MKYYLLTCDRDAVLTRPTLEDTLAIMQQLRPEVRQCVVIGWVNDRYDDTLVFSRSAAGFTTPQTRRLAAWRHNDQGGPQVTAPRDRT